jgi:hypothetical protein
MIGQFFPVTFPAQGAPNIPFRHCFIANFRMIAAKDALVTITSGHFVYISDFIFAVIELSAFLSCMDELSNERERFLKTIWP